MHRALLHWIWNLVISLRAVSLLWVFWVLFCFAQSLVAWRCPFSTLLSEAGYFLCSWAHLSSLFPWVCNLQSLSSSATDSTWSWLAKALLFPSLGWICALLFPQKIPGTQILSQKRISLFSVLQVRAFCSRQPPVQQQVGERSAPRPSPVGPFLLEAAQVCWIKDHFRYHPGCAKAPNLPAYLQTHLSNMWAVHNAVSPPPTLPKRMNFTPMCWAFIANLVATTTPTTWGKDSIWGFVSPFNLE